MSIAFIAAALQDGGTGLTLQQVISDIPHDPAAFVVYAMLAASGLLIWKSGRGKTKS